MKERLQKVLARAGLGSRRHCEELISGRRVKVNDSVADQPGVRVDPVNDTITVDGSEVRSEPPVYYLLNKPKGYVCTNRPRADERAAVHLVSAAGGERLFSVGRLDEESQGALILTNDGEFCNLITHPRFGVAKTYRVRVRGRAETEMIEKIRQGIFLAEGRTAPAKIQVVKRTRGMSILHVTLREGKNRHLRRVFAQVGLPVADLTRIRIGPLGLGRMKTGAYRPLQSAEVEALRTAARGDQRPSRRPQRRRR